MKKFICCLFVLLMFITISGCETDNNNDEEIVVDNQAVCQNGIFEGACEEETGVLSFKGIPYAKAPVGELRWKAPQEVEESDEVIEAYEYGKSSIQYYWHSEDITTEVGEDCLSLNIWTDSLETKDKAVMVFFHGGSYAWGGSSEPLYNGQYIVNEHNDVIVVTCNYRLGIMGFVNFDSVEGGEDYSDSKNLGLLDCIQALRWINKNIEAFGGDPNNITIFGESAGGSICASLLLTDAAGELFQRAIVESGPIGLTMSSERSAEHTENVEMLMEYTGAQNMEELVNLSEEKIIEANEYEWDEDATTINDCYNTIIRDVSPINDCSYEAYGEGKVKNVDIMIGSNLDEMSYWINEMNDVPISQLSDEEIAENIELYNEYFIKPFYDSIKENVSAEDYKYVEEYMALYSDMSEEDARSRLLSDLYFRASAIATAEKHSSSDGTGKTYMYLFTKENTKYEFMKSCHASELSYVFHNLETNEFSGYIDEELADKLCEMWVNFAKTGDPSISDVTWEEYDETNRMTMIIGNDNSLTNVSDPYSEERVLLSNLNKYYLAPIGA